MPGCTQSGTGQCAQPGWVSGGSSSSCRCYNRVSSRDSASAGHATWAYKVDAPLPGAVACALRPGPETEGRGTTLMGGSADAELPSHAHFVHAARKDNAMYIPTHGVLLKCEQVIESPILDRSVDSLPRKSPTPPGRSLLHCMPGTDPVSTELGI